MPTACCFSAASHQLVDVLVLERLWVLIVHQKRQEVLCSVQCGVVQQVAVFVAASTHCARQAAGLQRAPTLLLLPAHLPCCSAAGLRASRCALCCHGSRCHQSWLCYDESVCRALRCVAKKNGRMISSSTKQPQQRAAGRQASVFQQSAREDKRVRAAAWPEGASSHPQFHSFKFHSKLV